MANELARAAAPGDAVGVIDRVAVLSDIHGVRGLGEVLFCHATPRDDEEFVLVDSPLDRWALLGGAECDFPDIAEWTRFFLREPTSDRDALAVFTPKSR